MYFYIDKKYLTGGEWVLDERLSRLTSLPVWGSIILTAAFFLRWGLVSAGICIGVVDGCGCTCKGWVLVDISIGWDCTIKDVPWEFWALLILATGGFCGPCGRLVICICLGGAE